MDDLIVNAPTQPSTSDSSGANTSNNSSLNSITTTTTDTSLGKGSGSEAEVSMNNQPFKRARHGEPPMEDADNNPLIDKPPSQWSATNSSLEGDDPYVVVCCLSPVYPSSVEQPT